MFKSKMDWNEAIKRIKKYPKATPEKVYRTGVKAFAEDRKETQPKTNVVSFLDHLKEKRSKEIKN